MIIFDDSLSGRPENILPSVRRKLSAYTRSDRVNNFKIGITSDPVRRFQRAYAGLYDEMILLYRSLSIDSVSVMECDLILHNWAIADNLNAGGGGRIGIPPYFLYIVTR